MKANSIAIKYILSLEIIFILLFNSLLHSKSFEGEILRVTDSQALITLGSKDGLRVGSPGEIVRKELLKGHPIETILAELKVLEVYTDSAKIEIRKKLSAILIGDIVRVEQENLPPVFQPTNEQNIREGSILSFLISAEDPDSDPLQYSALDLPEGAVFFPDRGELYWEPDTTQSGSYTVQFRVSDGMLDIFEEVDINVQDYIPSQDECGILCKLGYLSPIAGTAGVIIYSLLQDEEPTKNFGTLTMSFWFP
jgi:hypothetical protein